MDFDWDGLRVFLSVARLGGLSAATATTGLSAATLGRRITALERQVGEKLFSRSQAGYRLTEAGEDLLARADDVETAMMSLRRWKEGRLGEPIVRLSAGPWTSAFVSSHISRIWDMEDRFELELITGNQKVDIGRRHADLGIRNQRPTEQWLAARLIGKVAYALYSSRDVVTGIEEACFVGLVGSGSQTHSARWMQAYHADRIGVRGNDAMSVRELVANGAGTSVFPCFVGDSDPRLIRTAPLIKELETDQWLVSHHEERHEPSVRTVIERIVALMQREAPLFRGERPVA